MKETLLTDDNLSDRKHGLYEQVEENTHPYGDLYGNETPERQRLRAVESSQQT